MLTFCAIFLGYGVLESDKYERDAHAKADEYARYTREKVAESCVGIPALERIKCLYEATDAQSEYEYNQADLVAQRQSALWAYIMAAAAIIGMVLSAVGIWLVYTTFRETRRAAEVAEKNYKAFASFESAILTVEFAEAPTFFIEKGRMHIRFGLKCANVGRSSAIVTAVRLENEEPAIYSFITYPGAENTFDLSKKIDVVALTRIRGYIQYTTQLETGVRRFFYIDLAIGVTPGQCSAYMHTGGVMRKDDEKYEKALQSAHS